MTQPGAPAVTGAAAEATAVVDLGLRACQAYHRPDLGERLTTARRRLADPGINIVVIGEFKQGKSSLVNALVGAPVCPVDDDIATALPTYLRHGAEVSANLIFEADPPRREPIPMDQVRGHVVEGGEVGGGEPGQRPVGVEILLPRTMLAGGLVIIDTPGLGGLGSTHAAASLAATSMADAVLFVTDASQELTRTEVDFLTRARGLCDTVAVVLTKTDFYPAWRTIRDLDTRHLQALGGVPLIAVSSTLRAAAVRADDTALNTDSGFPDLVRFVTSQVAADGVAAVARQAAGEVAAVCGQIESRFETERAALADPATAQQVIAELTTTKQRMETLKAAAARWNTTLGDGIGDLSSDIDYDLRSRIRRVIAEADEAIDATDPLDTWSQMEPWLESRISYELVANYTTLRDRAVEVSQLVGEHFREAAGEALGQIAVYDPTPLLDQTVGDTGVKLEKMSARKQTMVALKNSYSGIVMFSLLGGLVGLSLTAIAVPVGLMMGRSGLREEKRRQLAQRQNQAKNAVRRYCDEVTFVVSKDSRDTLRRIQRQLRDHYSARAEELNRSTMSALQAASEAVKRSATDRETRIKDLDAELGRLRQLRRRAEAVGRGGGPMRAPAGGGEPR